MITNDRQYKIVKSQIQDFKLALDAFPLDQQETENIHPIIMEAQRNAILSKLNELVKQTEEYDALKAGQILVTNVRTLKDLPIALIQSRIANGYSQSKLAEMLEMKEQQLQRYEAERYDSASLKTLLKIAEVLKIRLNADILIKEVEAPAFYDIKHYPFKQIFNRKWFTGFSGTLNDAVKNSATLIAELYQTAGISNLQTAFNRRSIRAGASINNYALEIWYARVIIKAREQELDNYFIKEVVTDQWLHDLRILSTDLQGPLLAINYLKNSGIRVIIEPALDGTMLDGAALLLDDMYPVIALTLRYDRLDNFWFVLLHELAHVVLHLGSLYNMIFDDLDKDAEGTDKEKEADLFALNALIPDNVWKKSLVRFSPSNETIINQAKGFQIHPALIAGRIRRQTGKYFQFNDLIGQGEVRKLFNIDF